MFIQQLPFVVQCLLLFAVGCAIGSLVNLAIYQLAEFNPRNISPWSPALDDRRRDWRVLLPIVGWFLRRDESSVHGRGFWVRPMLIELGVGLGLTWFYFWQTDGGLFGQQIADLAPHQQAMVGTWTHTWFYFHSVLFVLMLAATFIDFDEKTIPDWITVPGTLFAFLIVSLAPMARLPVIHQQLAGTLALVPLTFTDPEPVAQWQNDWTGLLICILVVAIWSFALIPKWATLRLGLSRGIWLMWVSILNPPRKTTAKVAQRPRGMRLATKVFLALGAITLSFVFVIWNIGGESWNALFDSLLGLAMGGGIVWAVRIVAGRALGTEAMGFGDVTLMAMIGAFLGWQAALLTFVIAPFTSILVALIQLIVSGEQKIAFGPYLCLGASILLIGWNWIWNEWASTGAFALGGQFLLVVIIVCLVLMAVMLGVWGKFKHRE